LFAIITQFSAKEAVLLASAILKNPDALDKHFQRSSASATMSILYDYPTLENEHDETITQIHAFIDRMTRISHHHSSGSFYSGDNGVLQDLMSKASIRGNLTGFVASSALLAYISIKASVISTISYGVILSEARDRSTHLIADSARNTDEFLDGSTLLQPLPHIQPLYYAAIIAAQLIGSSGSTTIVELTVVNTHISDYSVFEGNALVRAVFINLNAFTTGTRNSVNLTLNFSGYGKQPASIVVTRLCIP
jgi:hypothetical protein